MSLRAKLYVGFLVMIVLSFVIGGIAVYAFVQTQTGLAKAAVEVEQATNEETPVNDIFFDFATNTISAGFYYYGYAFNYDENDFVKGDEYLKAMRKNLDDLEKLLATRPQERLPKTRAAVSTLKSEIDELDRISGRLNDTVKQYMRIRAEVPKMGAGLQTAIDDLYADTAKQFESALAGLAPDNYEATKKTLALRAQRLSYVDSLNATMNNVRIGFWKALVFNGEEADKVFDDAIKSMEACIAGVNKYNVPENIQSPDNRKKFSDLAQLLGGYLDGMKQTRAVYSQLDKMGDETIATYTKIDKLLEELSAAASKLLFDGMANITADTHSINRTVDWMLWLLLATAAAVLVIGIVLAVVITRGITLPINRIIGSLSEGSRSIASASSQIASASQSLAEGATEQAASLEQTSSALEEMASMTRQNADNTQKTNDTTRQTAGLVEEGGKSMNDMARAMAEISERSDKVSRIIKTIEDIAFQTNLLALNAAVEAARAGEAGKGFAVVADEVRNLSQRSAQAARDTTELIQGTVESVRNGSEIAGGLTENFKKIEDGTQSVGRLIQEITSATNEQAQGVDQVNTAVAQMDKVTQQNAANAEQTASASEELTEQAASLDEMVGDLVALVNGKSGSVNQAPRPKPRLEKPAPRARRSEAPYSSGGSVKALPAKSSPKVMKPSEIIPLENEDDFGDF